MNDTDKRAAYTAGLRLLADALDTHPDIPLPSSGSSKWNLISIWFRDADGDPAKRMADARRALGMGTATKSTSDAYFDLDGQLAGLHVQLTAQRKDVCERVVVGTETVTKTVPDPTVVVPQIEVTETVDVVRWECRPLLAGGAS